MKKTVKYILLWKKKAYSNCEIIKICENLKKTLDRGRSVKL